MLEKMDAFFEARLEGYEEHMLANIDSARVFYPFTAAQLPTGTGTKLLDLGCGTGLELKYYFPLCPTAEVTGVDLSSGMLEALENAFPGTELSLICGSYFDVPFGENCYDAAVSVESLHHFTKSEKIPLYRKLHAALKGGSIFVLTDYFAANDAEEDFLQSELLRLKRQQGITDTEFYHFDTPLTVEHETEALLAAGFSRVEDLGCWGATHTLKACK